MVTLSGFSRWRVPRSCLPFPSSGGIMWLFRLSKMTQAAQGWTVGTVLSTYGSTASCITHWTVRIDLCKIGLHVTYWGAIQFNNMPFQISSHFFWPVWNLGGWCTLWLRLYRRIIRTVCKLCKNIYISQNTSMSLASSAVFVLWSKPFLLLMLVFFLLFVTNVGNIPVKFEVAFSMMFLSVLKACLIFSLSWFQGVAFSTVVVSLKFTSQSLPPSWREVSICFQLAHKHTVPEKV